MDHTTVRSLLSAYMDDAVSPAERQGLEEHLESCADCRAELAELEKTVLRIRGFGEEDPPPWMTQQVMARVRETAAGRRGFFHWLLYPLRIKLPIEAAALVVIAATGYMLYRTAAPQLAQVVQQAPELHVSEEVPPPRPAAPSGKPAVRDAKQARKETLPGDQHTAVQRREREGASPVQTQAAPPAETSSPPSAASAPPGSPPAREGSAEHSIMMEKRAATRGPVHGKNAAGEDFGMTAPNRAEKSTGPDRSRSASIAAAEPSAVRLVVEAADRDAAMGRIGAVVGRLGGSIVRTKITEGERGVLLVRIDSSRLDELHERLAGIGTVRGEVPPEPAAEGRVDVTIEVVGRTE